MYESYGVILYEVKKEALHTCDLMGIMEGNVVAKEEERQHT